MLTATHLFIENVSINLYLTKPSSVIAIELKWKVQFGNFYSKICISNFLIVIQEKRQFWFSFALHLFHLIMDIVLRGMITTPFVLWMMTKTRTLMKFKISMKNSPLQAQLLTILVWKEVWKLILQWIFVTQTDRKCFYRLAAIVRYFLTARIRKELLVHMACGSIPTMLTIPSVNFRKLFVQPIIKFATVPRSIHLHRLILWSNRQCRACKIIGFT